MAYTCRYPVDTGTSWCSNKLLHNRQLLFALESLKITFYEALVEYMSCAINLCYTRDITSKRITSGGVNLHGSAGQRSSEECGSDGEPFGDNVSEMTKSRIEPQTPHTNGGVSDQTSKISASLGL